MFEIFGIYPLVKIVIIVFILLLRVLILVMANIMIILKKEDLIMEI